MCFVIVQHFTILSNLQILSLHKRNHKCERKYQNLRDARLDDQVMDKRCKLQVQAV